MKLKYVRYLCSATKNLDPIGFAPRYKIQVHLDKSTGKLYWTEICGNAYVQYNDPDLVFIGNIEHPATMAEIREMVEERLRYLNFISNFCRDL